MSPPPSPKLGAENISILSYPRTRWRQAPVRRARMLVDAQEYYRSLSEVLERARFEIWILAWDFHTRCQLREDLDAHDPARAQFELGNLLHRLARERPELQIHVLLWDYPLAYQIDREMFTGRKLKRGAPPNLHFSYDSRTPVSASHHEKVVVVDDELAFVGGLDLTANRWDTIEHRAQDPRRGTGFAHYLPFHDCEWMVQGDIARELGQLARERWALATGTKPAPVRWRNFEDRLWPGDCAPDLEKVRMAISRTRPLLGPQPEAREVEQLLLRAVRSAQKLIYIENQYLAADRVRDALIESLRHERGPEVVIVLPRQSHSRLERLVMGVPQELTVRELQRADRHARLGVFYPHIETLRDSFVLVHSKLMIVDDRFITVGSANLNNRSMGLDTECNVSFEAEAEGHPREQSPELSLRHRRVVAQLRNRLLGEHLGLTPAAVEAGAAESTLRFILSRAGLARSLRSRPADNVYGLVTWLPRFRLLDPDRPSQIETEVNVYNSELRRRDNWGSILLTLLTLGVFALLLSWRPLHAWQSLFSGNATAWATLLSAYALAGVFLLPLVTFWVPTILLLGVGQGWLVALGGSLLASSLSYAAGRMLRPSAVTKLARRRARGVVRRLVLQNLPSALARAVLSVGPTPLLSLVSGVMRKRYVSFLLATFLRLLPVVSGVAGIGYILQKFSVWYWGPLS